MRYLLLRRLAIVLTPLMLCGLASRSAAAAPPGETVLYNFCGDGGEYCTDGSYTYSGLIMDAAGRLYGTADYGGDYGQGVVFALTPNADKTSWKYSVLYSFCPKPGCADGRYPYSGLIMDRKGTLYGTTWIGGDYDSGTVFALTPNAARTKWTEMVLHSFCAGG